MESLVFAVLLWNLGFQEMRSNGIKTKQNKAALLGGISFQQWHMCWQQQVLPRGLRYKIAIQESSYKETKGTTHVFFKKTKLCEPPWVSFHLAGLGVCPNLACLSQGAAFLALSSLLFLFWFLAGICFVWRSKGTPNRGGCIGWHDGGSWVIGTPLSLPAPQVQFSHIHCPPAPPGQVLLSLSSTRTDNCVCLSLHHISST